MRWLAARVGCTEGQAYTLTIVAALMAVLTLVGLPPALRDGAPATASAFAAPVPIPGYTGEPVDQVLPPAVPAAPVLPTGSAALPAPAPPRRPTPLGGGPSPLPSPSPAPDPSPSPDPSPVPTGSDEPAPDPATEPPPEDDEPDAPDAAGLAATEGAYARAVGGPVVGGLGVPEGGLPVGARGGQEDARAYLRLDGTGTTLRLAVHPDTTAAMLPEDAALVACPITELGWQLEDGAALDDAPAIDEGSCVPGLDGGDGSWTFGLAALGELADGVAIVAVLEPGATFQVTFTADG